MAISISLEGRSVWNGSSDLSSVESMPKLPAPSDLPPVWAIRDDPRFVPPEWGPTPATSTRIPYPSTSGFDVDHAAPDAYFFFPSLAGGYTGFRRDVLKLTGPIAPLPDYAFGSWFLWCVMPGRGGVRAAADQGTPLIVPPCLLDRYHNYTQSEKQAEVEEFAKRAFPLDVSGVDMDWRYHPCYPLSLTPQCEKYTHDDEAQYLLNTDLWPNLTGFVDFLKQRKIALFFNDHPMQVNTSYVEMSPLEIRFRWDGLTSMLTRGIDFWWFDCHWNSKINTTDGVDYIAWEKYVQFEVMARFNRENRPGTRTMQLGCSDSARLSDHRYPTWWTGDIQYDTIADAVRDSVNGGLQLRPYIHPDCGGHHGPGAGGHTPQSPAVGYPGEVFVRWVQFCSLGTILRLHSDPQLGRQPWKYGPIAENVSRSFMRMRLALAPTLIAAGNQASADGTPVARRLDLEFPQYPEAQAADQYLLGDDLLVAPVDPWAKEVRPTAYRNFTVGGCFTVIDREACCAHMDGRAEPTIHGEPCVPSLDGATFSSGNTCEPSCWVEGSCGSKPHTPQSGLAGTCYNRDRTVWVPPGKWEDAWSGEVIAGPVNVSVHSTEDRIPLYHRRPGLLLTADATARNVQSQDRRYLIVEAFSGDRNDPQLSRYWQLEGPQGPWLHASIHNSHDGVVSVRLRCAHTASVCNVKSWLVRVHLLPHQQAVEALADGVPLVVGSETARLLRPEATPGRGLAAALQGMAGIAPPTKAGAIMEVALPARRGEQQLLVRTRSCTTPEGMAE